MGNIVRRGGSGRVARCSNFVCVWAAESCLLRGFLIITPNASYVLRCSWRSRLGKSVDIPNFNVYGGYYFRLCQVYRMSILIVTQFLLPFRFLPLFSPRASLSNFPSRFLSFSPNRASSLPRRARVAAFSFLPILVLL